MYAILSEGKHNNNNNNNSNCTGKNGGKTDAFSSGYLYVRYDDMPSSR